MLWVAFMDDLAFHLISFFIFIIFSLLSKHSWNTCCFPVPIRRPNLSTKRCKIRSFRWQLFERSSERFVWGHGFAVTFWGKKDCSSFVGTPECSWPCPRLEALNIFQSRFYSMISSIDLHVMIMRYLCIHLHTDTCVRIYKDSNNSRCGCSKHVYSELSPHGHIRTFYSVPLSLSSNSQSKVVSLGLMVTLLTKAGTR